MARWTKNHMLELGIVLLVIGLIGTTIAVWDNWFADAGAGGFIASYRDLVETPQGDYNLVVLVIAPIFLIWGGFWVGEQIIMRRRFERLLDTPKRSEFTSRRSQLEEIIKRLPDGYKARLKQKESEFSSRRA